MEPTAQREVLLDMLEQISTLQNVIERVLMNDGASQQTRLQILQEIAQFEQAQKSIEQRIKAL